MNSLSQLNTFSATVLDVTDLRGSKVIFDRKSPLDAIDQILTITTTTTEISPGIEIEEIINYQTANVRYVVTIVPGDVTPLVGSTITWTSLPAGVVLTQGGGVYTISNINTIEQWDALKKFNWNLPANATSYPLWYLTVQVIYYDSRLGTDVDKSWLAYDDRFYYLSAMQATASVACPVERVIGVTANLNATAGLVGVSGKLQIAGATLSSSFSLTATGGIVVANINAISTVSATATATKRPSPALTTTVTLSVPTTKTVKNISRTRAYVGNNENVLFPTNVPYIDSTDTSGSYTITFSSSIGTFSSSSTTAPTSPWSYTGTLAEVNAMYSQILFYPTKDYSSTGTFTYTHALDGTTEFSRTVNLTGTAGSFNTQIITFTTIGSQTWNPTNAQRKYGKLDVLVVGGGGRGGLGVVGGGGGGGGAGGAAEYFNQTINSTGSYTIIVGEGGETFSGTSNGKDGGYSRIYASGLSYYAQGGERGYNAYYASGVSSSDYRRGGRSGGLTSYTSYVNAGGPPGQTINTNLPTYTAGGGGGGAGAAASTSNTSSHNGGIGFLSTITGNYYGGGGGGGTYLQYTPGGTGGAGGGANGAWHGVGNLDGSYQVTPATTPTPNSGGGGGGGGSTSSDASLYSNGASGVVVIKIHS